MDDGSYRWSQAGTEGAVERPIARQFARTSNYRSSQPYPASSSNSSSRCGLYRGIERLDPEPWIIRSEDDLDRLIDTLIDPTRRMPVFRM